jgi:hypothetical protein
MKRAANHHDGGPCPGCPIFPHIPDRQFRFPSCELCHWPAVGAGAAHAWRCVACRHWNEHGHLRPRVAAVLLRLADLDLAALRLEVVDPRYGIYLAARAGCQPCPSKRWRRRQAVALPSRRRGGGVGGGGLGGARGADGNGPRGKRRGGARVRGIGGGRGAGPGGPTGPGRQRGAVHDRVGRPVFARATVDGLPVLIIGGDRTFPYPLGLAENDREPCTFGSRATRIACPCDQPPPCLHGQALYAHVVTLTGAPARRPAPALALSRSAG